MLDETLGLSFFFLSCLGLLGFFLILIFILLYFTTLFVSLHVLYTFSDAKVLGT